MVRTSLPMDWKEVENWAKWWYRRIIQWFKNDNQGGCWTIITIVNVACDTGAINALAQRYNLFIWAFPEEMNKHKGWRACKAGGMAFHITGPLQPTCKSKFTIVTSGILGRQATRSPGIVYMSIKLFLQNNLRMSSVEGYSWICKEIYLSSTCLSYGIS